MSEEEDKALCIDSTKTISLAEDHMAGPLRGGKTKSETTPECYFRHFFERILSPDKKKWQSCMGRKCAWISLGLCNHIIAVIVILNNDF